jgi:hypothetical protein
MMRVMGISAAFAFLVMALTGPTTFAQNVHSAASMAATDDLVPMEQDGKWGYADKNGKVVIKPQFSRAGKFSEGLALVWTGGLPLTDPVATSFVKMGYINGTGHWVIHSRLKYYFFDEFSEGLVPFRQQASVWGYMDRTGKIVIRPQFEWAGIFSGGIAPALLDDRCTRIDKTGKVIDRSEIILPRKRYEQDSHGAFLFKPESPPCA